MTTHDLGQLKADLKRTIVEGFDLDPSQHQAIDGVIDDVLEALSDTQVELARAYKKARHDATRDFCELLMSLAAVILAGGGEPDPTPLLLTELLDPGAIEMLRKRAEAQQ